MILQGSDNDIHDFNFKLAAEDATTHHPGVDIENSRFTGQRAQDDDAHDSVVTESIDEPKPQGHGTRDRDQLDHILPRVSTCRCVELIRLIDELYHTRQIDLRNRAENYRHFEPGQEFIHALRNCAKSFALGIRRILNGTISVFIGKGDRLEIARIGDAAHIVSGIGRQFRHCHHRKTLPHTRAFDRIIVNKYKAIEPDVQLLGYDSKVLGFVIPVRLKSSNIGSAKNHLWMVAKHSFGNCGIVL